MWVRRGMTPHSWFGCPVNVWFCQPVSEWLGQRKEHGEMELWSIWQRLPSFQEVKRWISCPRVHPKVDIRWELQVCWRQLPCAAMRNTHQRTVSPPAGRSPENQGELHKWPPIVRFPRKDELIAHKEQKLSIQSLVLPSLIFDWTYSQMLQWPQVMWLPRDKVRANHIFWFLV